MVLITCTECNREISDKTQTFSGGGASVAIISEEKLNAPIKAIYNSSTDTFSGTKILIVKLAIKAVQEIGWKLDQANESRWRTIYSIKHWNEAQSKASNAIDMMKGLA